MNEVRTVFIMDTGSYWGGCCEVNRLLCDHCVYCRFDLSKANLNDANLEKMKSADIPDVVC